MRIVTKDQHRPSLQPNGDERGGRNGILPNHLTIRKHNHHDDEPIAKETKTQTNKVHGHLVKTICIHILLLIVKIHN